MKKFVKFRFGDFSHRSTGFGEEGGMERLKVYKVCFPPGLTMNGPASLDGLGKKPRVSSYAKFKNNKRWALVF